MSASPHRAPEHRLRTALDEPHVRVGLLAAAALLVEVVLARSVLHLELDFVAQLAALWVFVAYKLSGRRDRLTEIGASVAVVAVTATVLLAYAL